MCFTLSTDSAHHYHNIVTEEVSHVAFPSPSAFPKLLCRHCAPNPSSGEQGRALHCKGVHPLPHKHIGKELKQVLATGGTITTPLWRRVQSRCFVANFHHETTVVGRSTWHLGRTVTFKIQLRLQRLPKNTPSNDLKSERPTNKHVRGAEKRGRYPARHEAAAIAKLRELEGQEQELWRTHGSAPQLFLARKTGLPSSIFSKFKADG